MAANNKEENIQDLKKHLALLQEKITELEGAPKEPIEIKEIYSWKSPERIYRKKSKRWQVNLMLLVLIALVILLFLKQIITMAAVLSLGILLYVIDAVPPEDVEHTLTTEGVNTAGKSYLWEELYDFWFLPKGEYVSLNIDTNLSLPRRIIIFVKKSEEDKIKKLLLPYIPFREKVELSWYEKASNKLASQFHHLVGF